MVKFNQFYDFLFYKSRCRVPPNFTSYEAQSETNLAFPYLCVLGENGNFKKILLHMQVKAGPSLS